MGWGDTLKNALGAPFRALGSVLGDDAKPLNYNPNSYSPQGYTPYAPSVGNQINAAYQGAQTRFAPQNSILNNQLTGLNHLYGLTSQQFDLQGKGLNANYGFDTRSLGIKEAGLGLDRAAIDRQDPLLHSRLDMMQQMRAMLDPEFARRTAEIKRGTEFDAFRNQAETRTRGAMGSEGYRRTDEDISAKGQFATDELKTGYERNVLSADDDVRTAGENILKNKDARAQLDLQAQQLGVDRDRLASSLSLGLQRLGLDRQISLDELFQRMSSNRVEYQMLGQRIFDAAMNAAPLYASAQYLPPSMQAALTGKGV